MKRQYIYLLLALLIPVLAYGCMEAVSQTEKSKSSKTSNEKNDWSIDFDFSGKKGEVNKLFRDALKEHDQLDELDDQIDEATDATEDAIKPIDKYLKKNDNYYGEAMDIISSIDDPQLKSMLEEKLNASKNAYSSIKEGMEQQKEAMNTANSELMDAYNALKIIVTLPMVENYQKNDKPISTEHQKVIEQNKELLPHVKERL